MRQDGGDVKRCTSLGLGGIFQVMIQVSVYRGTVDELNVHLNEVASKGARIVNVSLYSTLVYLPSAVPAEQSDWVVCVDQSDWVVCADQQDKEA